MLSILETKIQLTPFAILSKNLNTINAKHNEILCSKPGSVGTGIDWLAIPDQCSSCR